MLRKIKLIYQVCFLPFTPYVCIIAVEVIFSGENKSAPSRKCPFLSYIFVIHVLKSKIRIQEIRIIHPVDQSANMDIEDFDWREIFVHDVEIFIKAKFIITK